jgi:hypothetical protein
MLLRLRCLKMPPCHLKIHQRRSILSLKVPQVPISIDLLAKGTPLLSHSSSKAKTLCRCSSGSCAKRGRRPGNADRSRRSEKKRKNGSEFD